jgi:pilus assembly protein FimV
MVIDKNKVIKEAQKFAAKGQFDKAVLEWRKLLKDYPSDSSIFNTIGDLCLKKGGAKGKAEAVEAYYRAGTILAAEGFTSKAIAVYKKVLNIDPNKMEVHLALGDMNAEKGLTGNALESYKLVADHYSKNQEMKKALGIYQKMADLNPSNSAFRLKLADMYAKEGMKNEAIKAYLEVADVHMSNKAFKEARQIFEKALVLDPNSKQVYHKAGIVYFKEGKFVEACKALRPVFEGDPSNKEVEDLYLDALSKAGRGAEAEEVYKKLLGGDAGRTDLRQKLYQLYLANKDYDKALVEASAVAGAQLESKEFDAVESMLKGFVTEAPKHVGVRRLLSDVYQTIGKSNEAAEELVQAAEILVGSGDKDGAKDALAKAIELSPDLAEARQRLESLQGPPVSSAPPVAQPAVTQSATPARPAAAPAVEEDPAIAEAITEADVLVKYGLSSKALEQLEGLARKFPESVQVRTKLRDLYGDQGNVGKAVAHMLVLAGIYAGRGLQAQAESVLRSALELDPGNAEIQSRLGIEPAISVQAPVAPGELTFEEPLSAAPSFDEALPPPEVQPEISAGLDMTPPELGEELAVPGPAAGEEPALEEPFEIPDIPEGPQPSAEEPAGVELQQPVPEERAGQPSGLETEQEAPVQEPQAKEVNLGETWAEAEFYYQQGLFDEAKKHYAKIIQYDPGDKEAIDRLAEISREAEETQEFSKLAEAVDGLEGYAPAGESGEVMAASESDDEAVRTLMREIAQLKQQPPAPSSEDAAAPASPKASAADGERNGTAASGKPGARHAEQRADEDFFDLGEELRESGISAAPAEGKEKQATEQSDDFFDLALELRDELSSVAVPPPSSVSAEEQSLDDIFEEFKKGVEHQAVKEDVDTHYNLGVAYKEMGLLDDAIAEFVLTPEEEPKFIQSRYMLGLCYMEKGEYQNAIAEIQNALNLSESPGGPVKDRVGMHYDLGLAYQGAGDASSALTEFQKVYDADPGYRDTAAKVKELRTGDFISLEQLKDDIEKEISFKFLEEGERIEREEKTRKNEKVRS